MLQEIDLKFLFIGMLMTYTTGDYKRISIVNFKKRGSLQEGRISKGSMTFSRGSRKTGSMQYLISLRKGESFLLVVFKMKSYGEDERRPLEYKIQLSKTPCNFGGFRYWFICPCTGRRCAKLYLQNNGIFCDRKAMNLCYPIQLMSHRARKLEPPMYQWELDRLYASIKVFYRNGKPTRKYEKYIRNSNKLTKVFKIMLGNDIARIEKWGLGHLL